MITNQSSDGTKKKIFIHRDAGLKYILEIFKPFNNVDTRCRQFSFVKLDIILTNILLTPQKVFNIQFNAKKKRFK